MFARRKRPPSQESQEPAWLLTLVILSVALPTAGFLWFMHKAMVNERAIIREQTNEISGMQLADSQRLIELAIKRISANIPLLNQADLTDEQRFHRLINRGVADSLIGLSAEGQPRFPHLPETVDALSLTAADEKAVALIDDWDPRDGYPSLLEAFARDQCREGRDWSGRYLYPNLQLAALESEPPDSAVFTKIAEELGQELEKRDLPWPTAQRLALSSSLRKLGQPVEVPSGAGFELALDVLEHPIQLGQAGTLQPAPNVAGVWRLLTEDRRFLLLYHTASIRNTLEMAARKSAGEYADSVRITPMRSESPASLPVGPIAPLWHIDLPADALSTGRDLQQRRAFILAMSCMLVALIGVIATFAIRRFLSRSRLSQLRNDFLSTISHELKTPLASTRMLVDTLVGGNVKDPKKARDYLEVIGRENTRLSHLVENFLTYSRMENGRMPFDFQAVMPEDVANQALDALESKLSGNAVDFQVTFAEGLPYIRADEATLGIALIDSLRKRIEKGQLKNLAIIERKIGNLQKKHPRVQRFYKLTHKPATSETKKEKTKKKPEPKLEPKLEPKSKPTLKATRDEAKIKGALALCGDYVLKTDKDMGAAELWSLYMTLLKAESGFRMLKGTLGLRPNFHQLEHRVEAHIFISVLAYHLLSWVRHHLEKAGDSREWKTLRRLLSTHSLVSTRLPLADGRIVTVRKPSLPNAEQSRIYQLLGIDWKQAYPAVKSELKGGAIL